MSAWCSPLDPAAIFSKASTPQFPERIAHKATKNKATLASDIFAVQPQVAEKGRLAAVLTSAHQATRVLTPASFTLRSGVNEYGGKCHCLIEDAVVFNDAKSGEIIRQELAAMQSAPLSRSPQLSQYVDLSASDNGETLLAVREAFFDDGRESQHQIVGFDLRRDQPQMPQVLISGADFYAQPQLSPDGRQVAWLEWDHPYMPWDQTRLMVGDFSRDSSGNLCLENQRARVDFPDASVCQLGWLADGSLLFSMDGAHPHADETSREYWNLYRWQNARITALTADNADYGEAHWVYGYCRWVQLDEETVLAVRTQDASDELVEIDLASGETQVVAEAAGFSQLSSSFGAHACGSGEALGMVALADGESQVFSYTAEGGFSLLRFADTPPPLLGAENISLAQPISYPVGNGEHAHGFYYPPKNAQHVMNAGGAPAALVMVHGGPTSRTTAEFALLKQYFTTSGFAVFDVNHRGSTGYGRAYRQRLLGGWGEVDAEDIAAGVQYLVEQGLADAEKIFIRGSSAGGYAVLRALTRFPEVFAGGACYYGIGNLVTLAEITHKFESRYTDRLIGEAFDPKMARQPQSEYMKRSPIFEMGKIRCPVILFQGREDKVVPPAVSREVVETLAANGMLHDYVEYEGEGHGFRQAVTRIDALEREMQFYSGIIGA